MRLSVTLLLKNPSRVFKMLLYICVYGHTEKANAKSESVPDIRIVV